MSIKILCQSCGATLKVADESVGKSVRCPRCKEEFRVRRQPQDGFGPKEAVVTDRSTQPQSEPTQRSKKEQDRDDDALKDGFPRANATARTGVLRRGPNQNGVQITATGMTTSWTRN